MRIVHNKNWPLRETQTDNTQYKCVSLDYVANFFLTELYGRRGSSKARFLYEQPELGRRFPLMAEPLHSFENGLDEFNFFLGETIMDNDLYRPEFGGNLEDHMLVHREDLVVLKRFAEDIRREVKRYKDANPDATREEIYKALQKNNHIGTGKDTAVIIAMYAIKYGITHTKREGVIVPAIPKEVIGIEFESVLKDVDEDDNLITKPYDPNETMLRYYGAKGKIRQTATLSELAHIIEKEREGFWLKPAEGSGQPNVADADAIRFMKRFCMPPDKSS